jgi:hypothetical protein
MDIDTSDWQEEKEIEGEDPEDTALLRPVKAVIPQRSASADRAVYQA